MSLTFIEASILRLCKQPRTFQFIADNLDGFDPISLNNILASMEQIGYLHKKNNFWTIKEEKQPLKLNLLEEGPHLYLKKYMGYFDFLKLPHPLDFEWRNSTASLNNLIDEIVTLNSVSDKILLLGMPTLFATACIKDIPQKVTLVEINKPIIRGLSKLHSDKHRFQILEADIFKVVPNDIGNYHSVIMDPPWYSKHFYQFMWLASQCVSMGGFVAISLPPLNTRPDISKERIEWFSFCHKQGLCLEYLYSQKLQYAMPFFEFNAFRAAGVKDIQPFWRKGDFAIFRKVDTIVSVRPVFDAPINNWVEREIEAVRFRIKKDQSVSQTDLEIKSIVKGDILPTVSARDERRKEANIWTSGNRIFKVNNPNKFVELLDSNPVNDKNYELVRSFTKSVSEFEQKEYNHYLEWLYLEMESK